MEEGEGHFHIICMVSIGRGDEVPSPNEMETQEVRILGNSFVYVLRILFGKREKV